MNVVGDVRMGIFSESCCNQSIGLLPLRLGGCGRVIVRKGRMNDKGLDSEGFCIGAGDSLTIRSIPKADHLGI